MRSALLSASAVATALRSAAGSNVENVALDLRGDAQGLGSRVVSQIASDLGFRYAVHGMVPSDASVLPEAPDGTDILTSWWERAPEPLVTFRASVISVKRVAAGSQVSYGYHYTTPRETTLALVSAGFADGVPRSASGSAWITLDGRRGIVAGRIAMDQLIVDCGDVAVQVGDEATLWGDDPTVSQWSEWSGRSEGALLSHLGTRVVKTWV